MNIQEIDLLESLGADVPAPSFPNEPSNHYTPGVSSSIEDRALHLLGAGVEQEAVASALGVTASRISQLLADDHFSSKVSELRYASLTEHNLRDGKYDKLEDRLLDKLDKALPLLVKPESILKAVTIVNGAKRRGHTTTNQVTNNQNIVNLILPSVITQKFTTNIDNQVIKAGNQDLLTMASGNLLEQVEKAETEREALNVHEEGG